MNLKFSNHTFKEPYKAGLAYWFKKQLLITLFISLDFLNKPYFRVVVYFCYHFHLQYNNV